MVGWPICGSEIGFVFPLDRNWRPRTIRPAFGHHLSASYSIRLLNCNKPINPLSQPFPIFAPAFSQGSRKTLKDKCIHN